MMEKRIIEFERTNNPEGEAESFLKVMAVAMNPEEQKQVREELKSYGFRFDHIEADMVTATLHEGITPSGDDTYTADELVEVGVELERKGWTW